MFSQAEVSSRTPSPSEIILSFAATNYPDLLLQPKMMEQLLWLQNNSISTSQSSVQSKPELINIEVKRVLSRFYCLKLLETGDARSYQLFIRAQAKDNVLSNEHFNQLSNFIQALSAASRKCLIATCFITKSDQAIMAVPSAQRGDLPADSEQFITHMVTNFPTLYPVCALLTPEERDSLPYAFYKNAHARQMLDMEGGHNMISSIAEGIRTRKISQEQFHLWFARWIINIAGLDGHINTQGSSYLTQPVADCIFALKLELDQLWINPNHPVLDQYLMFRAKQLNVTNRYIAYFGALMRQYTPSKGQEIQAWFSSFSMSEQIEHQEKFNTQLQQTKVTPSFKPTVLVNLLTAGCSVSEALTLFTQIESSAMQRYVAAIAEGDIPDTTPLSFRNIAFKESLLPILDYYNAKGKLPDFELDSNGYLMMKNTIDKQKLIKQSVPETLVPPRANPFATVASRRNPCYGFAVVSYIDQNSPTVNAFLMATRDAIIKIVDPDRTPENCPRKLLGLIKTKSLHASFYGSAPYLRQDDYATFFQSKEEGLDNGAVLHTIKEKLTSYLRDFKPLLIPVGLEFKEEDGTILARYRVETNDNDQRPLVSLKKRLDAGRTNLAPLWDPNPLRDTTVAIVLCVAAVKEAPAKIACIKAVLSVATEEFRALGVQSINHYSIINAYDKRTLTRDKHVKIFAEVDKQQLDTRANTCSPVL